MRKNYDVIVIGLGAMGSAAQYQLAARGKKSLVSINLLHHTFLVRRMVTHGLLAKRLVKEKNTFLYSDFQKS